MPCILTRYICSAQIIEYHLTANGSFDIFEARHMHTNRSNRKRACTRLALAALGCRDFRFGRTPACDCIWWSCGQIVHISMSAGCFFRSLSSLLSESIFPLFLVRPEHSRRALSFSKETRLLVFDFMFPFSLSSFKCHCKIKMKHTAMPYTRAHT